VTNKERYIGIDYLKALFSICVVAMHLGYISPSSIFNKELYMDHRFTLSDFVNFYVLLLAVPVFFIISNYLFLRKPVEWSVCYQYLKRIIKLAIFWPVLLMFDYQGWQILAWLPRSGVDLIWFILSGGNTIYYFFVSLIGLTIITHFSKSIRTRYIAIFFILTTLLVSTLPLISMTTGMYILTIFWNPLNFLPYPFAALLVSRLIDLKLNKQKQIYLMIGWFLLCFLTMIIDWVVYIDAGFFEVSPFAIPAYTRSSLIFISMAVLYFSIKIRPKFNRIIDFMSRYSLGLYCLHIFFVPLGITLSKRNIIMSLPITLSLSYLAAIIWSKVAIIWPHFLRLSQRAFKSLPRSS
jgi:hypothetical protein